MYLFPNNTMRTVLLVHIFIVAFLSLVPAPSYAQAETLRDMFPIQIGNSWKYSYYHYYVNLESAHVLNDTGYVTISVISDSSSGDTLFWRLKEESAIYRREQNRRTGQDTIYPLSVRTYESLLMELMKGRHELVAAGSAIFQFPGGLPDSAKVNRYALLTDGVTQVKTSYQTFNDIFEYTFATEVGLKKFYRVYSPNYPYAVNSLETNLLSSTNTGVSEASNTPIQKRLCYNYPNPFNPSTGINFILDRREHVKLIVFDVCGHQCEVLEDNVMEQGEHRTTWNAEVYPSGVYYYLLVTPEGTLGGKMALVK